MKIEVNLEDSRLFYISQDIILNVIITKRTIGLQRFSRLRGKKCCLNDCAALRENESARGSRCKLTLVRRRVISPCWRRLPGGGRSGGDVTAPATPWE